eukprot:1137460-Prymnesium_polylepis.1
MRSHTHALSCTLDDPGASNSAAHESVTTATCSKSARLSPRINVVGTTNSLPSANASKPSAKTSSVRASVISPSATSDGPALLNERRATPLKKVKKKRQASVVHRPSSSRRFSSSRSVLGRRDPGTLAATSSPASLSVCNAACGRWPFRAAAASTSCVRSTGRGTAAFLGRSLSAMRGATSRDNSVSSGAARMCDRGTLARPAAGDARQEIDEAELARDAEGNVTDCARHATVWPMAEEEEED